jgi:hypothetical protein
VSDECYRMNVMMNQVDVDGSKHHAVHVCVFVSLSTFESIS